MEKVVICSPQLGMSPDSNLGGEVHDREMLKALADLGVEIHIILPLFKKHEKHENFHFYYLPVPFVYPPWVFNLLILPYLAYIYLHTRFSILRVHSTSFSGLGAVIFKFIFRNIKIVSTIHHIDSWKWEENFVATQSDLITTVSQFTKNEILGKLTNLKQHPEKVVVIPNAVSEKYCRLSKNTRLVTQYNLMGKRVLLFLGQFIKRKNLAFLIYLTKKLPENYLLLLCGGGPETQNLKLLARRLNLEERVIFTGVVPEDKKVDYYNLADFFVYPSLKEGYGLSVVEAMACEKIVFASSIPPFLEITAENTNILTLPLSIETWYKEILSTDASPSRKRKITNLARKFAKKITWRQAAQDYLESLRSVLKASK